jgi:hypothetical protein
LSRFHSEISPGVLHFGCDGGSKPSVGERVLGVEELSRLDLLPRFKHSVKVGLVSSYDRSGGNDDGFSGKYSFIRKEPGGLVIAGPRSKGLGFDLVEIIFEKI